MAAAPRPLMAAACIGDRVLLTTMEVEGTITALWPDGAAYIRDARGEVVACGTSALVPITYDPRP